MRLRFAALVASVSVTLKAALWLAVGCASLFATTFIVPSDRELIKKSAAIVSGVIISARAVEIEDGFIETEYEVALDEVLKGPLRRHETLIVRSAGGQLGEEFTLVHSSAHFRVGDDVLLFLVRHRQAWATTDMTLGKFSFRSTSAGHSVLVRDAEDIHGWDKDGKIHQEKIRRESEFLNFIRETVAGREAVLDYEVAAADVLPPPRADADESKWRRVAPNAAFSAETYANRFFFCDGTSAPGRWPTSTMNAGVPFLKNSAQNASSTVDGGAAIIQSGLNAWTNHCASAVTIPFGGGTPNLKNPNDNVNVVVFNDPGNHIQNSWTGSGVVATAFSRGSGVHLFEGIDWITMIDTDIVFQDGFPGNDPTINTAMTHEIGHAIGMRHADKSFQDGCSILQPNTANCSLSCPSEPACTPGNQECASTSIMTAVANSSLGFTLQTWDQNAANALYPASCVAILPPTNVAAISSTPTSVFVSWSASSGAANGYLVFRSSDGVNYAQIGTAPVGTSFQDTTANAGTGYLYRVRAVDGSGNISADSGTDFATTVIFTDSPLMAAFSPVRRVHVEELRAAANALRVLGGSAAFSFTDVNLTAATVRTYHLTELRSIISSARTALGLTNAAFTDPTITAGVTGIKAIHFNELRSRVQ